MCATVYSYYGLSLFKCRGGTESAKVKVQSSQAQPVSQSVKEEAEVGNEHLDGFLLFRKLLHGHEACVVRGAHEGGREDDSKVPGVHPVLRLELLHFVQVS